MLLECVIVKTCQNVVYDIGISPLLGVLSPEVGNARRWALRPTLHDGRTRATALTHDPASLMHFSRLQFGKSYNVHDLHGISRHFITFHGNFSFSSLSLSLPHFFLIAFCDSDGLDSGW